MAVAPLLKLTNLDACTLCIFLSQTCIPYPQNKTAIKPKLGYFIPNANGESFANMLKELHTKRHANDFIEREKINEKFRLLEQDMPYKGLFSDFGDKTKYNGTLPTGAYLYQMYKQNHGIPNHINVQLVQSIHA